MTKYFLGLFMVGMLFGCSQDIPVSSAQQLKKDVAAIDKYLTANNIVAVKDTSGLRYVVKTLGAGLSPTLNSLVKVKYTGRLLSNQAVFDQSSTPLVFFTNPLSGLINGWQIAFQYLPKGSVATLYIPSVLGYGVSGRPPATPANANLIFEVELIDFK